MQLTAEITIAASPLAVFDFLTDRHKTMSAVERIKDLVVLTPGPLQSGTEWIETIAIDGNEVKLACRMTEFDRPTRFAFTTNFMGIRVTTSYELSEIENGTQLRLESNSSPVSPIGFITQIVISLLFSGYKKKSEDLTWVDLNQVKAAIEAVA